ncbi:hypothetical protein BDN70DRAFT_888189 [Pholiota conissans]|uniref:Uncharacterized protein n=1 Tax=Pholiota conissans TaxID=109636 RepID=A0A9P5YP82_9AGAR|nr:hypothetical protein BDN70DRAFT_888189 [Pholiota conissans]
MLASDSQLWARALLFIISSSRSDDGGGHATTTNAMTIQWSRNTRESNDASFLFPHSPQCSNSFAQSSRLVLPPSLAMFNSSLSLFAVRFGFPVHVPGHIHCREGYIIGN